jgi:hypothetical protein
MPFLISKFMVFYNTSLYAINQLKGFVLLFLSASADGQGTLGSPQKIFEFSVEVTVIGCEPCVTVKGDCMSAFGTARTQQLSLLPMTQRWRLWQPACLRCVKAQ